MELVAVVDKQPVTASGISLGFLIGEVGVDLMKSLQQTLLFHKREKGHPLPGIFLSVQINLEVCRVEVNDGGVLSHHELSPRLRQEAPASCRKHTHQLLQGMEWFRTTLKVVS